MRHVGGAHRGLDMWLLQRASALYMAGFLVAFLVLLLAAGPMGYETWRGLFAPMYMKVGGLLFVTALLVHAWIGLREIFIDYVHCLVLRLGLYLAFGILYLGCLAWSVDILWSVK
ncbi:MAG: succinate dehydrogenase hydrophobic membrane anchor protein [bacterium]|nr:MAG: succinate dehydrogenase hydrophobic membrane anchor protein [bacterium]KAF0150399.1 MAG: succinate dehydrogenase hydrophobic membrane anchor protein [bacterium]KAF0168956.1 MAG: succinate dehydrogenase hydrophobic membrane anchor protein [bacterium]TXT32862.1 MAG: succinate dehydrogenase hydrophobic membrane anchor protein [Rhodocyclaceae bacterium]